MTKLWVLVALAFFCVSALANAGEPELMHWSIGGVARNALVYYPSLSTSAPAPVIFAFHGHGGNMNFAARGMHFQSAWPEAIVIYMQGLPTPGKLGDEKGLRPGWQHDPGELGDRDLKFFDAVLATLHKKFSVDDRRVYATGFSNGGFFTYLLWAERPSVFAALAPGAGLILPSAHPTQPRPCLHFGGKRDRLVRFENQERTIDEVRQLNGCAEHGEPCGTDCTLYPSSTGNPLETYIHPGGHFYPPGMTGLIVKFFQEHPRNS